MSSASNGKRNRSRQPYQHGKHSPWRPGDEREGDWSRERLIKMDARFRERIERAFRFGLETREAAVSALAFYSRTGL